jgi:hypothetical protein
VGCDPGLSGLGSVLAMRICFGDDGSGVAVPGGVNDVLRGAGVDDDRSIGEVIVPVSTHPSCLMSFDVVLVVSQAAEAGFGAWR